MPTMMRGSGMGLAVTVEMEMEGFGGGLHLSRGQADTKLKPRLATRST